MQLFIEIIFGFIIFFLIFTLIEKIAPAIYSKRIFRRGFKLDLLYWVMAPTINAAIKNSAALLIVIVVASVMGLKLDESIIHGFGPIIKQPSGIIVMEMLVLGDFINYWMHRWFHRQGLWKIHAIHHSSTELDWLSSVRVHPFNQAIANSVSVGILLGLGFPMIVLAAYLPFLLFYAVLLHANVPWGFGPLRYVIASPKFHRWHHTTDKHGLNKNFAGLFPIFDLIFGTFYMPKLIQPAQFGIRKNEVPNTLWGQMMYPLRKK